MWHNLDNFHARLQVSPFMMSLHPTAGGGGGEEEKSYNSWEE